MTLPLSLPDWMPSWVYLLIALPVLLWILAFLLVPFSVIGLKARLEALESQIDEMHEDLRIMAMRASGALPPAARSLEPYDEVPDFGALKKSRAAARATEEPAPRRAPIPTPQSAPPMPARERLVPTPPARPRRTEPRLD